MQLSEEQIHEFQRLYHRRFGLEINRERAYEEGVKLVRLMQLIYKPMTKEEYERLQERRRKAKKDG